MYIYVYNYIDLIIQNFATCIIVNSFVKIDHSCAMSSVLNFIQKF